MANLFRFKHEESPHGQIVAIYEITGHGATGEIETRVGTFYPDTQIIRLSFKGRLENLIELLEKLQDFLKRSEKKD